MNNIKELFQYDKKYYEDSLHKTFPRMDLDTATNDPLIIYGAARMGKMFFKNLQKKGQTIAAFADSNQKLWGKNISGIPIISPATLKKKYFQNPILIASLLHEIEIVETLKKNGFPLIFPLSILNYTHPDIFISPVYFQAFHSIFVPKSQTAMIKLNDLWADEESREVFYHLVRYRITFDASSIQAIESKNPTYFDPAIMTFSDDEVFLDCGAYIGDSLKNFHQIRKGRFNKIYAFEPDRKNYPKLCKTIGKIKNKNIVPINKGIFHTTGLIPFCEAGTFDTHADPGKNSVLLPVVSIDDFIKNKVPPSFIKMDVEGVEKEALKGTKQTIQKVKPKLAICLYHKANDLWEIPLLIKSLNKKYKLFLRYYGKGILNSICYAI